jgi:hypothetical protein
MEYIVWLSEWNTAVRIKWVANSAKYYDFSSCTKGQWALCWVLSILNMTMDRLKHPLLSNHRALTSYLHSFPGLPRRSSSRGPTSAQRLAFGWALVVFKLRLSLKLNYACLCVTQMRVSWIHKFHANDCIDDISASRGGPKQWDLGHNVSLCRCAQTLLPTCKGPPVSRLLQTPRLTHSHSR